MSSSLPTYGASTCHSSDVVDDCFGPTPSNVPETRVSRRQLLDRPSKPVGNVDVKDDRVRLLGVTIKAEHGRKMVIEA